MISFLGGTTINSMLSINQMNMKWEERKNNIGKNATENKSSTQAESSEIKHMKEITENSKKASYIQGLQFKLKSGGTLTSDELNYLKANNPQMYKDAVEIAEERARYKQELERCRTKEEADRLNFSKIGSLVSQARPATSSANRNSHSVQSLEKIMAKIMGIKVDFDKYFKTGAYDSLPSEKDENNNKKIKRKSAFIIENILKADYTNALKEIEIEIARITQGACITEQETKQGQEEPQLSEPKSEVQQTKAKITVPSVQSKKAMATPKFIAKV